MKTYAASGILHHEHKGTAARDMGGRAFLVQCAQTDAVVFEAVGQGPGVC